MSYVLAFTAFILTKKIIPYLKDLRCHLSLKYYLNIPVHSIFLACQTRGLQTLPLLEILLLIYKAKKKLGLHI